MSNQVIVVRKSMLAETFGAHLLSSKNNAQVVQTDNISDFDQDLTDSLSGKDVLFVGGYFNKNLNKIVPKVFSVKVFLNSGDDLPLFDTIKASENKGFISWVVEQYDYEDYIKKIATYLDSYLYGFISEESILFQNGVYALPGDNNLDKISSVKSLADIDSVLEAGVELTNKKRKIAEERLVKSQKVHWTDKKGHEYEIVVGLVPSEIVLTCSLFASNSSSGVGMGC